MHVAVTLDTYFVQERHLLCTICLLPVHVAGRLKSNLINSWTLYCGSHHSLFRALLRGVLKSEKHDFHEGCSLVLAWRMDFEQLIAIFEMESS